MPAEYRDDLRSLVGSQTSAHARALRCATAAFLRRFISEVTLTPLKGYRTDFMISKAVAQIGNASIRIRY